MRPPELRAGPHAADRALARRDPALPALVTVLDPDALLALLDGLLPAGLERPSGVAVRYVRYKPGTALVAALALETSHGVLPAYAKAVSRPGVAKLEKALRRSGRDPAWPVVADRRRGIVIGTAACDRQLPGARRLLAAGGAQVLRYKPERRLVVRTVSGGLPLLRKAHRPAFAARAAAIHGAARGAGVPVPALLRHDRRRGVVTTAWLEGAPLHALGLDAGGEAGAGSALALLHRCAADLGPQASRPPDTGPTAAAIEALVPELGARADALARRIEALLAERPFVPAQVHGDWSADQALVTGDGVVMLDLDRARRGDPAADVGSWVAAAHAASDVPEEGAPAEIAAPLLAGYRDAGGRISSARLDAQTAAALLRRAPEPFRLRAPDWPQEVERLLALAERQLAGERPR